MELKPNENKGTTVHCIFQLERKSNYHLVSVIFPTFVLIIMAELALFIDKSHFEATIMVALTIMLVLYTLYQSVSQGLPKTSYLKLIDVWLMFGLISPFFIFLMLIIENSVSKRDFKKPPTFVKPADTSHNYLESLVQDGRKDSARTLKIIKICLPTVTFIFVIVFLLVAYTGP